MRSGPSNSTYNFTFSRLVLLVLLSLEFASIRFSIAAPSPNSGRDSLRPRNSNPLNIDWDPAPSPEDGPALSANAIRDPAYLPAQISGIVGSYAVSLVLVAVLLLVLSKKRREHLANGEDFDRLIEPTFNPFPEPFGLQSEEDYHKQLADFNQGISNPAQNDVPGSPKSFFRNYSLPSNTSPLTPTEPPRVFECSPTSTVTHLTLGVDLSVDQSVVAKDRAMSQQQLEDMYRHVMEQEQAKEEGRQYELPPQQQQLTSPSAQSVASSSAAAPQGARMGTLRKEKNKPASLNLSKEEKPQSKTSSFLSMLKSPRKKQPPKAINISSPMSLTPMSGTFPRQDYPRHESQEMNMISPRHYAPPPPPPMVPIIQAPVGRNGAHLPTPEVSPDSTQSIDERIDAAFAKQQAQAVPAAPVATNNPYAERPSRETHWPSYHRREPSTTTNDSRTEVDPVSASSEKSVSGLVVVGLPTSPKPGVNRFPSLASLPSLPPTPKPGQTSFSRGMNPPPTPGAQSQFSTHSQSSYQAPTPVQGAVRAGGALPFRAYEHGPASPTSATSTATKQTVFTRVGPLSPGGMHTGGLRTPWTGAPVPYSPYQPFSPVVPITPSLVTRDDRKRMKRLEPKTPTVEMVRSSDDLW